MPVEVIGVQFLTPVGLDAANATMYNNKRSPWVKETSAIQPYVAWRLPASVRPDTRVAWRDAIIIDENGEFLAVQSLTNESLSIVANRTALTNTLSGAAGLTDTDADDLPDAWELDNVGNINSGPMSDPLKIGRPLLLSYAQAVAPTVQQGPQIITQTTVSGVRFYEIEFRRRLGLEGVAGTLPARLVYTPEAYNGTTKAWVGTGWTVVSDVDPFDGTGTRKVKMRSPIPASGATAPSTQFVRLKVSVAP